MTRFVLSSLLAAAFAAGLAPSDIAALRQPGATVPSGTLPAVAGGSVSLRSTDGKPTVIVVFANWCEPCHQNMNAIVKLAKSSSARFVGIDALESAKDAQTIMDEHSVPFQVALLTTPEFQGANVTDEQRGATGIDIPAVYVIDPQGKTYKAFVGAAVTNMANISAAIANAAK